MHLHLPDATSAFHLKTYIRRATRGDHIRWQRMQFVPSRPPWWAPFVLA